VSDWEVVPEASEWSIVEDDEGPPIWLDKDKFRAAKEREANKYKSSGGLSALPEDLRAMMPQDMDPGTAVSAPLLSMADRASFGLLRSGLRGATRINEATGTTGPTLASRSLKAIEDYRHQAPTVSQYTDIPAYFTAPARALAGGIERALPHVATLPGRVAKATVAAGGTNAVMSGAEAANRGATISEVGEEALHGGGTGMVLGAGLATPLSLAGMAARAILGSRGGQARRFLESKGAEVGPGTPGRGPVIDTMATRGTSDADIGLQAEVSAKRGLDMLNEEKRGALGAVGRKIGRVAKSPEAARLNDASGIVADMEAALDDIDISPQSEQSLRSAIEKVRKAQGEGFNPETDPYLLSEADINKLKRRLDRAGKTGLSTDEATSPIRRAANETRAIVNEGPFAEANAEYARESKRYQESRKLLGINERPKTPEESQAATSKVKNLITRRGQNTVTAGGQEDKLAQFESRHPDIADEFARPEILRKRADISFHLMPQKHGGLIDRTGSAIGGAAALEALSHLIGSGHISPGKMAAAAALGLTTQNINAINARLLYSPALEALRLEEPILGSVPQLQAARNSMEQR
jgi:hypothetical protein